MTNISDDQHVARYCPGKTITPSGRITGAAFQIRPQDNNGLSTNWIECLDLGAREKEINHLSSHFNQIMRGVIADAKIAILNVGNTKNHVFDASSEKKTLGFEHHPNTHNPSHSRIVRLELNETEIFGYIAESVIEDYPLLPEE